MANTRILVVDDDQDFAEGLADILLQHGYEVELAFSGEEALEKFQKGPFDVTFMDVRLPGKNGVESFLEIRKAKPDARVIMMTGFSVEQLLEQAVENGAWAVLHKPFDPDKILKMLREIEPAGILIADDDPDTVEGICDLLENRGYKVFVARDGGEAVERVRRNGILDVLILDLRMPVLNGLEVYLELRRTGHALPTIVITAYAKEESAALDQLQAFPVVGVLRKPFDPKDLLALVESQLCKEEGEP